MTNENETNRESLREAWVEALLASALTLEDHSDQIARAMRRISEPDRVATQDAPKTPKPSYRWGAVALAASFVMAVILITRGGGNSTAAMSAVQRSLDVAAQERTRKYQVQVQYRTPADDRSEVQISLYVRGHDRFALRHPGLLPRNSFWLGKNPAQEWVVPPVGPVRVGTDMVLSRWLASHQQLETPYLQVTTLLNRMSGGYRLTAKPNEEVRLPDGTGVDCERVHAELESTDNVNLPSAIELWASRESGQAIRIVAKWNSAEGRAGRERIVITYQNDEPTLKDDWFTPESHYRGTRVIMKVDSIGRPVLEAP